MVPKSGGEQNLKKPIPIDASPPKAGVAIRPFCHCEASRKGSRGNLEFFTFFTLKSRLRSRFAPRNDNQDSCHKARKYQSNRTRNDKRSLLAIT